MFAPYVEPDAVAIAAESTTAAPMMVVSVAMFFAVLDPVRSH